MTTDRDTTASRPQSRHARNKARAKARAQQRRDEQQQRLRAMPITRPHAAGIDIGDRSHWVCVGFTEDNHSDLVREFPTHTQGLQEIIAYLKEHQVTSVALEATGIYWVALLEALQQHFEVILVDPSYTRQLRGRPKTDRKDAQWIYRLHSVGLLPAAFRPAAAIATLRSYVRQRSQKVHQAGQCIQRMQKALQQMNLKLTTVIDDITGQTGQRIVQAILRGTRDPHKLAQHRHPQCRHSVAEIAQALRGSYRDEHLFALRCAYEEWRFHQQQLDKVDAQIQAQLRSLRLERQLPPLAPTSYRSGRKANDPRFDVRDALYAVVGMDLTELEGLNASTALTLISEIGLDMSRFPSVKHFCSWLGLCPQWRKTGGKVKSSRVRTGAGRAATALRLAAGSLHRSRSALGAYLRRMKSRLGKAAGITATAHKLARLVYWSLSKGLAYAKQTQAAYEDDQRQREKKALYKRAQRLGLEVVERVAKPAEAATLPAGAATEGIR
jgi:transposase